MFASVGDGAVSVAAPVVCETGVVGTIAVAGEVVDGIVIEKLPGDAAGLEAMADADAEPSNEDTRGVGT